MKRSVLSTSALLCFFLLGHSNAFGGVMTTVNYEGEGAGADGLNASAKFDLVTSTQLRITLENTSVSPFGGSGVNGDASMVLSSLNFDLGVGVDITGGTVSLSSGSSVVENNKSGSWVSAGFTGNLTEQYFYSNDGIGNEAGGSTILSNITSAEVNALKKANSVTAHSNGSPTPFVTGASTSGGLDFSLVQFGSEAFGNNNGKNQNNLFVLNGIEVVLDLSSPLSDLSFLDNGSFVEFGSDHAFTGKVIVGDDPPDNYVPEPGSVAIWAALGMGGLVRRRRR